MSRNASLPVGGLRIPGGQRAALGLLSVAGMLGVYELASRAYARPDVLPPIGAILAAFQGLLTGQAGVAAGEGHSHHQLDHLSGLIKEGVTLQGALLASTLRVLFGMVVGGLLGILAGFWMGWSRDDQRPPPTIRWPMPSSPISISTPTVVIQAMRRA